MPSRKYEATNAYRYGFNGKENDNEVSGQGNQYDYGFRIYNPRLGRFLSVDPLFKGYPWYTPYQFAGNKPIMSIDLDGLENKPTNKNTSPTDPNERTEQAKEIIDQVVGTGKTILAETKYNVYVQAVSTFVSAMAKIKIQQLENEVKRAEKEMNANYEYLENFHSETYALVQFAKKYGEYDSKKTDEQNAHDFLMNSDHYLKNANNIEEYFNTLENWRYAKMADYIKKVALARNKLDLWQTIDEMASQFTKTGEIMDEISKIADIVNEKDDSKRLEKIQKYIFEKLRDRAIKEMFKKKKENGTDGHESEAIQKTMTDLRDNLYSESAPVIVKPKGKTGKKG
jgi:RHS repeat-associated protein